MQGRGIENCIKGDMLPAAGETVVAGVSGGADSVCLLSLLSESAGKHGFSVIVVHVNHGIRGAEADADEEFVHGLIGPHVSFISFRENIPEYAKANSLTEEEAGRIIRYRHFAEVCREYNAKRLYVAHNMNDAAETLLFNMVRGSSLSGLSGIKKVSAFSELVTVDITIYRPLLDHTRREIEEYLVSKGLKWREDATNSDVRYSRNRIRQTILPELAFLNPAAVRHLSLISADITEAEQYLAGEVDRIYPELVSGRVLDLKKFKPLPELLKKKILYRLLTEACGRRKDIERVHIMAILDIADGETGKSADLPYGITAEKEYDNLVLKKREDASGNETDNDAGNEKDIDLTFEHLVRTYKISESLKKLYNVKKLDEVAISAGESDGEPVDKTVLTTVLDQDHEYHVRIYPASALHELRGSADHVYFDIDRLIAACDEPFVFRNASDADWFSPFADGGKKNVSRFFIDEKIPQSVRSEAVLLCSGSHAVWICGFRNDEGFRIGKDTENILEIERIKK